MSETPIRPIPGKPTPILDGILNDLAREIEAERMAQPGDAITIMVSAFGPTCRNDRGDYKGPCDPPFGWYVVETGTKREAAAILRRRGWRFHRGYWYCPRCAPEVG